MSSAGGSRRGREEGCEGGCERGREGRCERGREPHQSLWFGPPCLTSAAQGGGDRARIWRLVDGRAGAFHVGAPLEELRQEDPLAGRRHRIDCAIQSLGKRPCAATGVIVAHVADEGADMSEGDWRTARSGVLAPLHAPALDALAAAMEGVVYGKEHVAMQREAVREQHRHASRKGRVEPR